MTEPLETIETDRETVACDGGDGPLGHPRVYLHIGPPDQSGERWIECPYCSRHYVLKAGARRGAAH
ncbi:MAG: zinc-finger domain-containing protein [Dongiaceae bacterium]